MGPRRRGISGCSQPHGRPEVNGQYCTTGAGRRCAVFRPISHAKVDSEEIEAGAPGQRDVARNASRTGKSFLRIRQRKLDRNGVRCPCPCDLCRDRAGILNYGFNDFGRGQEVRIPTPSAWPRAGSVAENATRMGHPHGLALDKSGGHCGRRLVPRRIPNQNRNCGPKVTRMLLWTPLLKKMLSPISARTPMGPAKASTPPPGYTEKYVAPLANPTAV